MNLFLDDLVRACEVFKTVQRNCTDLMNAKVKLSKIPLLTIIFLLGFAQGLSQDSKFTQDSYKLFRENFDGKLKKIKYSIRTLYSEKLALGESDPYYKIEEIEDFDPSGVRRIKYTKTSASGVYWEETIITDKTIYEKIGDQPWTFRMRKIGLKNQSEPDPKSSFTFKFLGEELLDGKESNVHQVDMRVEYPRKTYLGKGKVRIETQMPIVKKVRRKIWVTKDGLIKQIQIFGSPEKNANVSKTQIFDYSGDFSIEIPQDAKDISIK